MIYLSRTLDVNIHRILSLSIDRKFTMETDLNLNTTSYLTRNSAFIVLHYHA